MKYRRRTVYDRGRNAGKKVSKSVVLVVLLSGVVLYGLWDSGFFNFFSSSTKIKHVSSQNAVGSKRLRHEIYAGDMEILALSLRMYSVYVHPQELKKKENGIARLVEILALDNDRLQRQLRTGKKNIWLKRHVDSRQAEEIAALHLGGIYLVGERQRLYPHGNLASQVIGFVKEEQGLAGTEFIYDNLLRGEWPLEPVVNSSGIDYEKVPADGAAVVLTLDLKMQAGIEKRLARLIKRTGSHSGMAVLLNADNGEILAMANLPAYDPNRYWDYSSFNRRNRVSADHVYLGGLAKFFQLAAALYNGHDLVSVAKENPDAKLIKPRKIKLSVGGDRQISRSVWQEVMDGMYRIPYINSPVAASSDRNVENFVQLLGLGESDGNSVLGQIGQEAGDTTAITLKAQDQISLLNLAGAFARIINIGKTSLPPHLLHGVWTGPEKGEITAPFASLSYDNLFPNGKFLKFLQSFSSKGKTKPIVLESLTRFREKDTSDIHFAGENPEEVEGQVINADKDKVAGKRVDALGIGTYSVGDTNLVLAMAIDGVNRGFRNKAIFNRDITKILRSYKRQNKKRSKAIAKKAASHKGFNQQWRKIHLDTAKIKFSDARDDSSGIMPKLQGYSLRKSLQSLTGKGLRIKIVGSGRVVGQSLPVGVTLQNGQDCLLQLDYNARDMGSDVDKQGVWLHGKTSN